MEYPTLGDLSTWISHTTESPRQSEIVEAFCRIMKDVAMAMSYLHSKKSLSLRRHLRPESVMLFVQQELREGTNVGIVRAKFGPSLICVDDHDAFGHEE